MGSSFRWEFRFGSPGKVKPLEEALKTMAFQESG